MCNITQSEETLLLLQQGSLSAFIFTLNMETCPYCITSLYLLFFFCWGGGVIFWTLWYRHIDIVEAISFSFLFYTGKSFDDRVLQL